MSQITMQQKLIKWYEKYHRNLPWRETNDPYCIWLSEIMCQQTQVATVVGYYHRFLEKYPTIHDLALANEDDVYKLWEGLGYYSRAKRLMLCARQVVDQYDGAFPQTYKQMIKLPGIGPYTAGAVLSIAFGVQEPAIDGNVMRVYSRLYNLSVDVGKADARKAFDPYVRNDLPQQVSHFNQGLMELGATLCTPTKPKCESCPVKAHCNARELGIQDNLPFRTPKAKKKHKQMTVAYVTCGSHVLIEKRNIEGLLANLWGFPISETTDHEEMALWLSEIYGLDVKTGEVMAKKKHVFTHLVWDMTLVHFEAESMASPEDPEVHWTRDEDFTEYSLPTAFRKLL